MQGFGIYRIDRDRHCYRPPVPPLPSMDVVWDQYEPAAKAVEAFDRALAAFPVPQVIGKLFARLDAVHSSGAEGSTTTFTDLLEFQTSLRRARDPEDAEAVAGCAQAFDALASAETIDLPAAVLAIHHRLFEHARDPIAVDTAGHWKTMPNGVFDPDQGGFFYYTSPMDLADALAEWEAFTLEAGTPELVRQALSHWMFEHIHPVRDGNGRVGRLLVPLLARHKGVTRQACAFIGEAVHHNKSIYIDALKHGRRTGDMASWSRVFLSFMAQTARANLQRLERLDALLAGWQERTRTIRTDSVVHALVPWLLVTPKFTVTDAAAATGRSFVAVNTAVARLRDLGMITQVGADGRDRLFAAEDIIRLFEHPPP